MRIALCLTIGWLLIACDPNTGEPSTAASDSLRVDTEETLPQAIARLSGLIAENPRDYGLLQERAITYYQLDSLPAAIKDVDLALDLYPQSPELHYLRGLFAKSVSDSATAMREFQAAVTMGTQDPEPYYELGQQYFFRDGFQQAQTYYEKAAQLNPDEPLYLFAQGFLEERRENYSKAVNLYRQSLQRDSLFVKSLTRLHDVYFEAFGAEQDAALYNDRLLARYPTHPLGQYQRGSRYLREALQINKEEAPGRFGDAINTAVEAFTIAINSDPTYTDAYFSRGFAYLLGGQRIELATADFQKCLELRPNYPEAMFWLGSIQEKYGDYRSALQYYESALQLKPGEQDFIDAVNAMQRQLTP